MSDIDDTELRKKLTQMGVDVGPINQSTRELYRRMLRKRTNDVQASAAGTPAKRHKPAPSPTTPRIPKQKPVSAKPQRNGATRTRKPVQSRERGTATKVGVASQPAAVVRPSFVPSTPPNPYNRPSLPHSPPSYPYLPSLSPICLPPSSKHSSSHGSSPSIPAVLPFYQHKDSSSSDGLVAPPPSSPKQVVSSPYSTTSNSSGMVTTVTNWLGARVKKIIGRIQEVASPSPRQPLHVNPSPSTPNKAAPPSPRLRVSRDSISIDFSDSLGASPGAAGDQVYLHVPTPREHDCARHPPHRSKSSEVDSDKYDWELLPGDVEVCKKDEKLWLLGKGGCGQVYRGLKDRVDDVAVKVIRLHGCNPRTAMTQFKKEIDMISKLRHRHILQFYGACIQPSCLFMVTELMDTDLFSALRKGAEYTWDGEHGKEVLVGIASGLNHLHTRRPPIVHRDIKSPNILVMKGLAKIADVGIANTMAATDMTAQRGFTIAWAAPEVILRKRANEKIDIWSFGIILWEVVTGSMPRPGQLVFPSPAPPHLRSLHMKCTSDIASSRPTAADIIHALNEDSNSH